MVLGSFETENVTYSWLLVEVFLEMGLRGTNRCRSDDHEVGVHMAIHTVYQRTCQMAHHGIRMGFERVYSSLGTEFGNDKGVHFKEVGLGRIPFLLVGLLTLAIWGR